MKKLATTLPVKLKKQKKTLMMISNSQSFQGHHVTKRILLELMRLPEGMMVRLRRVLVVMEPLLMSLTGRGRGWHSRCLPCSWSRSNSLSSRSMRKV